MSQRRRILTMLQAAGDRDCLLPVRWNGHPAGTYTLVDEESYEPLSVFRWKLLPNGYVARSEFRPDGTVTTIGMHRQLCGLQQGDGLTVDHINGERQDNRRSNLRVVTHAQNCQNLHLPARGTSRYRGVYWDKHKNRWTAVVVVNGKRCRRMFKTEEQAAIAVGAMRSGLMPFSEEAANVAT